ncbi:hypothetical protein D3C85_1553220 [compost metagenome]
MLTPALPPVTPTVALVCRASSSLALRLSALPSLLNLISKLSPLPGEPLIVVSNPMVLAVPSGLLTGLPAASSTGTLIVTLLSWPGTILPLPISAPASFNTR